MSPPRLLLHALSIALVIELVGTDVQAYVDPGSGSVLLQVLIAGLLAVGFTIKTFWGNLKRRVTGLFSRSHKVPDDGQDPS